MPRILVVVGTRPEAIKLAPVVLALRARGDEFETVLCSTGQHRGMLDGALEVFGLEPDVDMDLMSHRQTLPDLTTRALAAMDAVIGRFRPDLVVVQGDTTSAMVGALAAYYRLTPVAHVEAGLRTDDLYEPFPEEGNRRLIGVLADLHFAPTPHAARCLADAGVPERRVLVTGNTVIDALLHVREKDRRPPVSKPPRERRRHRRRRVLLTMHRRENRGAPLEAVCSAVLRLVERNPGAEVVFPVHASPYVREPVGRILGGNARIRLEEPVGYRDFVRLLDSCHLVLTDSGGLQEEAPALGKPVLVLRDKTERSESVEAGTSRLVGTDERDVLRAAETLLRDGHAYGAMARAANPYGDGRATARIVAALRHRFGLSAELPGSFLPRVASGALVADGPVEEVA
ncbi:UDP-N-acetylglucosamine 2-epimerase (non-hydrolyzing) [Rubrobacter marinus]|uniref:UDP-N-acetylglucosamine 2-epimerase (non-hydrolyzing) n=1 Tax=Rubrobacter marinus TaxID=2653852 RepID=A0A6G8Q255_9ACTN|nr:UDP-N-acetylglucosamine 2-epimerase (non-hydrolyzing) [Rubrobacter marinus]QIN80538.1 UDP-N-acetylglucosamine 2-epimerase (non-hydrolyzing) [Rubrobacter marinus]